MAYHVRPANNISTDTGRGYSPAIWGDFNELDAIALGNAIVLRDDFVNFGKHNTDQDTQIYSSYIDTSNTIQQAATAGGVVELTVDATDNDSPVLQAGGGTGGAFQITTGTAGKLWFEARVQVSTLAEIAVFVGLGAPNATADNGVLVDDTGALSTSLGFIGWHAPAAASTCVFDGTYVKASGTAQVVASDKHTAVADTWVKLGFKFDPQADTLTYYVNGVSVGSADVSAAGTTNFPSAVLLSPVIAMKTGAAAAKTLRMDWWRCAQLM